MFLILSILFTAAKADKRVCWLESNNTYIGCDGIVLDTDKPFQINITAWSCPLVIPCEDFVIPDNAVIKEVEVGLPKGSIGKKTLSLVPDLEVLTMDIGFVDRIEDGSFCLPPKLQRLFIKASIHRNRLSNSSLSNCGNVKSLSLENVSIGEFTLRYMTSLEYISLREQFISHLTKNYFETLSNLKTLEISSCMIYLMDPAVLCSPPNVETLKFHHNQLPSPPTGLLEKCNKVANIECVYNDGMNMKLEALKGLSSVKTLVVDSVNVTHLKKGDIPNPQHIEILSIQKSNITEIESELLNQLSNMKELSLDYNNLSRFSISADLDNLTKLSLYNNQLTRFDPEIMAHLPNLTILNLSSNKLQSIDGIKHPKLRSLWFSCNEFGDFDLAALLANVPKLKEIAVGRGDFELEFMRDKLRDAPLEKKRYGFCKF